MLTEKPLVSVLMPVYNAEKYLSESIDSILAQTFTNFELLALDDGSSDGSLKILQQYAQRDTRLRVISRENRGISESLNEMIALAQGLWIARMDADDIALPHRLERQLEWLAHTDADICGSWFQRFGTIDRRIICPSELNDVLHKKLLFACTLDHPTVMMRHTVAALSYDKNFDAAEDYDLWVRAAERKFRITNVPEVLLLHRNHPGQISSRRRAKQIQLTAEIKRRYWKFMAKSLGLEDTEIENVISMFMAQHKKINAQSAGEAFMKLLRHTPSNDRKIIFSHITRLCLKNVADNYEIIRQWNKLNMRYKITFSIPTVFYLHLFYILKIRPEGNLFSIMKKIYFALYACVPPILQKKHETQRANSI